jgi:DNA-binding MarR family transcriptional regulator
MRKIPHNPTASHLPAAGKAVTELILETFRLNGRLLSAGDRLTQDLGLSSARWQVMGAIANTPLSVAQIARNMGLTRQGVQRIADKLAEENLVEFTLNPNHQRAKLVTLTPHGREVLQEVSRRQLVWANEIAKGVAVSELEVAIHLMEKVRKYVEEAHSQDNDRRRVVLAGKEKTNGKRRPD